MIGGHVIFSKTSDFSLFRKQSWLSGYLLNQSPETKTKVASAHDGGHMVVTTMTANTTVASGQVERSQPQG